MSNNVQGRQFRGSVILNPDSNSTPANQPASNDSHSQPPVLAPSAPVTGIVVKQTADQPAQRSAQVVQKAPSYQATNVKSDPGKVVDKSPGGRRGFVVGDEDRWHRIPGFLNSSRYPQMDVYGGNFQPGQWENVVRNPYGPAPAQYAGGILSGTVQSMGSHGVVQQSNSDADRWQRATYFQKGLLTSPTTPAPVMHKVERKFQVGKVTVKEEAKQRQLKAILNKLTPQDFLKLFEQVKAVNIDNTGTLTGFISQIFEKAQMEPTFCDMYADFCYHLAKELPDFCEDNEKITFKRLLLNKCQEEFERGERERGKVNRADPEGEVKQSPEESEEKRIQARRRMLGNIRFIGELYNKKMLTERIMHECIKKLLAEYQNPEEEDIEALCELMSTIGEMIDHPKAKEYMDAYFDIMSELSNNVKLSSRVRFMLKDVIDLRKNKWQLKKIFDGVVGDEDRWNKIPGPLNSSRYPRMDVYGRKFQPGHWENVLRNPHRLAPEDTGGILSGPMQSMGSHGVVQQSNSDAGRWQRAVCFQKGLLTSPTTPAPVMHKAKRKYRVGKVTDEEQAKQRQVKAILNKLTPQNFEKLLEQVKAVNIDNVGTVTGFISQIFDKALMEPTFCDMYADVCYHLAKELPDFYEDNEKITFKVLLLNKCQEEFERAEREQEEADRADTEGEVKQSPEEGEEKRIQARRRMLGNIRFIGELYNKKMLTERIMHECIQKLLGQYQNPDEEDIKALCVLMGAIGKTIDHPKAKEHMDAYFDRMIKLSNNVKLSSRVRFMLKDAIDLRKNKWQLKKMFDGENYLIQPFANLTFVKYL